MYDPSIGRWISEDPIEFQAGDANLYRYVVNEPTAHTDPTGLQPRIYITIFPPAGSQPPLFVVNGTVGLQGMAITATATSRTTNKVYPGKVTQPGAPGFPTSYYVTFSVPNASAKYAVTVEAADRKAFPDAFAQTDVTVEIPGGSFKPIRGGDGFA